MKNRILALILTFTVFAPFCTKVSAIQPEETIGDAHLLWTKPYTTIGRIAVVAGLAYMGYKIYDYKYFKNKIVHIEGNSGCGEDLGDSRADYEAKRQIRRVFDYDLSRWRHYFSKSDSIKAVPLGNINNCLVSIRSSWMQRAINTPEAIRLADRLWDKINFFIDIMDRKHEVRISELIQELQEVDSLVDEATVLINAHLYGDK